MIPNPQINPLPNVRAVIHIQNVGSKNVVLKDCPEILFAVLAPGETAGIVLWAGPVPKDAPLNVGNATNVKPSVFLKDYLKKIVAGGYDKDMSAQELIFMIEQDEKVFEEQANGGNIRGGQP